MNNKSDMSIDEKFMALALEQAKTAYSLGEVPVGAVIVKDGEVVGVGCNRRESEKNALMHAELAAIDDACKRLGGWRLWQCELYVTLEPCPMCAGAIINSRLKRLIYGAPDLKAGSVDSVVKMFELPYNHSPLVTSGVLKDECAEIMKRFFKEMRKRKA